MSRAEEFIKKRIRGKVNHITENFPWIPTNEALEAVEIAREEMIEKVCMYLNEHRNGVIDDEYIINLNKAMKDE